MGTPGVSAVIKGGCCKEGGCCSAWPYILESRNRYARVWCQHPADLKSGFRKYQKQNLLIDHWKGRLQMLLPRDYRVAGIAN